MKKLSVLLLATLLLTVCTGCGGKQPEVTPDTSLFDTVCSADEALAAARDSAVVVMEGLKCTSGQAVWDSFYQTVNRGEAAQVLCAEYYTLDPDHVSPELYAREKDQYPMLFFSLLEYDGDTFTVKVRQSDTEELDHQDVYPYLLHFTGDAPRRSPYSSYDTYVLVDDPTATMEGIWAGMVSSSSLIATGYRHDTVFQNFMERGENKPVGITNISLFGTVCSADEALERAKAAGIPVMENLHCTSGEAVWNDFYEAVSAGRSAQVLCAMYYTTIDGGIQNEMYLSRDPSKLPPVLYFTLLTYDGEQYTVTVRQSSEAAPEYESVFLYLLHFTGDAPPQSYYSAYDAYVLADDPNATMEKIRGMMVSSDPVVTTVCVHYTVFMNYTD